jgi:hypothetical protein
MIDAIENLVNPPRFGFGFEFKTNFVGPRSRINENSYALSSNSNLSNCRKTYPDLVRSSDDRIFPAFIKMFHLFNNQKDIGDKTKYHAYKKEDW